MSQNTNYKLLYKKLGYTFKESANLELALTHRSFKQNHNERLEYLGDAVLGLVVADELFRRFPKQPEGKLTRMRSTLVKGDTLALVAKEFELGDFLFLGSGELKSGGFRRSSILADTVEAIIGAIYLESGLEICQPLILNWFKSRLDALDPEAHPKDSKTLLQEHLQGTKLPLPLYTVVQIDGKDHDQNFTVECDVSLLPKPMVGRGSSRRKAEQNAAKAAYEKLNEPK